MNFLSGPAVGHQWASSGPAVAQHWPTQDLFQICMKNSQGQKFIVRI
jgi:hypothetical protein